MWSKQRRIAKVLMLLFIFLCAPNGHCKLNIELTKGRFEPVGMYISGLKADNNQKIRSVIKNNLQRSGLFFIAHNTGNSITSSAVDRTPDFISLRKINITGNITGDISYLEDGKTIEVKFKIWDIVSQRKITSKVIRTPTQNWRRIAHIMSDYLYEHFIGDEGYFDTRITYVEESGTITNKIKKLAIMDQDGENLSYLTDGSNMVMTPRFSPDGKRIIYMAYNPDSSSTIIIRDLETGVDTPIDNVRGVASAPRFSPDGKSALLSISSKGSTNIFSIDLKTGKKKALTDTRNINTSPSYSPDQTQFTFNSDRGGSPQIYTADANGKNVKRITFNRGSYLSPIWSPRGDYIAFIKLTKGIFYLGVIRPDGSGERLITNGYLLDNPSWSSNGRVVLFERQQNPYKKRINGRSYIHAIDVTGANEIVIRTPKEGTSPSWSYALK